MAFAADCCSGLLRWSIRSNCYSFRSSLVNTQQGGICGAELVLLMHQPVLLLLAQPAFLLMLLPLLMLVPLLLSWQDMS